MTIGSQASAAPPPPMPVDRALPGAQELLGREGLDVVDRFLARSGWRLQSARPVQTLYQPGHSFVVRYRTDCENPAGEPRMLWLCAEVRRKPGPALPPSLEGDPQAAPREPVLSADPYLVWSFPYDPSLPALAGAGRGGSVRRFLAELGRPAAGVSVAPVCYRPRRRATFRYTVLLGPGKGTRHLYGKVLTPDRATGVMEAAGVIAQGSSRSRWSRRRTASAPRLSLPAADTPDGLLLFEPLAGRSLRDLLLCGGSLPSPDRLPRLVDDLLRREGIEATLRRPGGDNRRDPERMLRHARQVLTHIVPEVDDRVDRLADAILDEHGWDQPQTALVHGDLYDAQIFVDADYSLGLIDLDDLGPGDRAMDAANLSTHLLALALAVPSASGLIRAYRRLARAAFMGQYGISPRSMAWREALVMLLLAPGPFRVLEPAWPAAVRRRVDLAARLFDQEL